MRVRLTGGDRGTINKAPPSDGTALILNDDLLPGFMLRVTKRARTYVVVTRVKGRPGQIRRRLGTTRDLELADARAKARQIIEDAQNGIAPGDAEKDARAADGGSDSFKAVADAYFEDTLRGGGAKLRTKTEMQRKVEKDLAEWLERPIGSITAREISDLIYKKAQTSPIAANRLVSFIKKLMRWAKRRHIIPANPAADIEKPSDEISRDRYLGDEERMTSPGRYRDVLHMLDDTIRAVIPERGTSWHPKAVLGRYIGPRNVPSWRLWLGSRNLTGGRDREAGLLLIGSTNPANAALRE